MYEPTQGKKGMRTSTSEAAQRKSEKPSGTSGGAQQDCRAVPVVQIGLRSTCVGRYMS